MNANNRQSQEMQQKTTKRSREEKDRIHEQRSSNCGSEPDPALRTSKHIHKKIYLEININQWPHFCLDMQEIEECI